MSSSKENSIFEVCGVTVKYVRASGPYQVSRGISFVKKTVLESSFLIFWILSYIILNMQNV